MSSPDNGEARPEFRDSDQAWYAALAGEAAREPTSAAAREGLALRAALEQRQLEMAADPAVASLTSDGSLERQLQRLRQQVKAEGVFDRPPIPAAMPPTFSAPPNVVDFPWWRRRRALVALAASIVAAAVLVPQLTTEPDYPQPPAMLGADGLQQVHAPQPRQAAEALAAQLRQADLRPGLFQRGSVYVVDINLMSAELPKAAAAFSALRIKPAVGFNRVEFVGR